MKLGFCCALVFLAGCGGGPSSSSDSSSSGPTSPTPANPAAPLNQTGCTATYQCPNVDANGVSNPSTPTFDQVTLSTGTSDSCRADVLRNPSAPTVPVQFTIRNPAPSLPGASYFWAANTSNMMSITPHSGNATSVGPFQTTAQFGNLTILLSSGQKLTETLELDIQNSGVSGAPVVARCGITVYGLVKPGG